MITFKQSLEKRRLADLYKSLNEFGNNYNKESDKKGIVAESCLNSIADCLTIIRRRAL